MLPRPRGRRVAIATTSGALGVIATDLLVESGLDLASFAPATLAAMRSVLPEWLEPGNPFDFWIGIDVKGAREAHETSLSAVLADPNVDLVLCTLLAPGNADFPEFGTMMRRLRRSYDKPILAVIYGGEAKQRWAADLEGAFIPVWETTRAGARALSLMACATLYDIVGAGFKPAPTNRTVWLGSASTSGDATGDDATRGDATKLAPGRPSWRQPKWRCRPC
jgi:acetyltransferase